VIDYKTQDFEQLLSEYDLVLNSQDSKTLEKSLRILRPGGKAVSISGPPDPAFANAMGMPWLLKLIIGFISRKVRRQAEKLGVGYSFLFMKANGQQLSEITKLVEQGVINPVLDKVYRFEEMNQAFDYVNSGRARGKVVVQIK